MKLDFDFEDMKRDCLDRVYDYQNLPENQLIKCRLHLVLDYDYWLWSARFTNGKHRCKMEVRAFATAMEAFVDMKRTLERIDVL